MSTSPFNASGKAITDKELAACGPEGANSKGTVMNPKDAVAGTRVPISLMPDTAVIAGAMAFVEGAVKYGRYNWRVAGVSAFVYNNAARRHLMAWFNGEDIDEKSHLNHLWKALACIAILIDGAVVGKLIDDRPPRAPVTGMLDALEAYVAKIVADHADKRPQQWMIADGMSHDEMIERSGGLLDLADFAGDI